MLTREELQAVQGLLSSAKNEFALGNPDAGFEWIGDAAATAGRAVVWAAWFSQGGTPANPEGGAGG